MVPLFVAVLLRLESEAAGRDAISYDLSCLGSEGLLLSLRRHGGDRRTTCSAAADGGLG